MKVGEGKTRRREEMEGEECTQTCFMGQQLTGCMCGMLLAFLWVILFGGMLAPLPLAIGVALGVTGSRTNDVADIRWKEFQMVFFVSLLVSSLCVFMLGDGMPILGLGAALSIAVSVLVTQHLQKGKVKRTSSDEDVERQGLLQVLGQGGWVPVYGVLTIDKFELYQPHPRVLKQQFAWVDGSTVQAYKVQDDGTDTCFEVSINGQSARFRTLSSKHTEAWVLEFSHIAAKRSRVVSFSSTGMPPVADSPSFSPQLDFRKTSTRTESRDAARGNAAARNGSQKAQASPPELQRSSSAAPSSGGSIQSATITKSANGTRSRSATINSMGEEDEYSDDEEEGGADLYLGFGRCRLKLFTLVRFLRVLSAYPFILIISTLNLRLRYMTIISRVMTCLIYAVPVLMVNLVLSQKKTLLGFSHAFVTRATVGIYTSLYLLPVLLGIFSKLKVASSKSQIAEGTFCFRPSHRVRFNRANFFTLGGLVMEFIQHAAYCLPTTGKPGNRFKSVTGMSFEPAFWLVVGAVFFCSWILIANSTVRGKWHYRLFVRSQVAWTIIFYMSGPLYVSVVTVLFQGIACDATAVPGKSVLILDYSIECWTPRHSRMASAALLGLAFFLIQVTLLPPGTFKETMRNKSRDVTFVPVYMMAHFLIKAVFCGVYVGYLNEQDWVRITILTILNSILLVLNFMMKPCSIKLVNIMRDTGFLCAVITGIQALHFVVNVDSASQERNIDLFYTNLVSIWALIFTAAVVVHYSTRKHTNFVISLAFLELEFQLSLKDGNVHPRVLEPLISLTFSDDDDERRVVAKYCYRLVDLMDYPNKRVQFQSVWALANIALWSNQARMSIHNNGCTQYIFQGYSSMTFVVQLEALAVLANLTLCDEIHEVMINDHNCIPFFVNLCAADNRLVSIFSTIALGNLARSEEYREQIQNAGGLEVFVSSILSDYYRRKYGCMAMANMVLSPRFDFVHVLARRDIVDRLIKIAKKNEMQTQREVAALLHNMSCHWSLVDMLRRRKVDFAVRAFQSSEFLEVVEWGKSIDENMVLATWTGVDVENEFIDAKIEKLRRMEPLKRAVTWATWGSKLDNIFTPILYSLPSLKLLQASTMEGIPVEIDLSQSHSRRKVKHIVVNSPAHGNLTVPKKHYHIITYKPVEGWTGTDIFTFKISNGLVDSAIATVSIIVRPRGLMPRASVGTTPSRGPTRSMDSNDKPSGRKWSHADDASML